MKIVQMIEAIEYGVNDMAKRKLDSGRHASEESFDKLLDEAFEYLEAEDGERAERISGTCSRRARMIQKSGWAWRKPCLYRG